MKTNNAIVWLRNELRLHDNEPLVRAIQTFKDVFVVYCLDERMFEKTSLGFLRTDYFRAKFLLESLQDLRNNLRKMGGELIIRTGKPEDVIPQLAECFGVSAVYCGYEVTQEETNIEQKIEKKLFANGVFGVQRFIILMICPLPQAIFLMFIQNLGKMLKKGQKYALHFLRPHNSTKQPNLM